MVKGLKALHDMSIMHRDLKVINHLKYFNKLIVSKCLSLQGLDCQAW